MASHATQSVGRNSPNTAATSAFFVAVRTGSLATVRSASREGKKNVHRIDQAGRTALHVAAELGYRDACGLLLAEGANVNAFSLTGATPLYLAAENSHREV